MKRKVLLLDESLTVQKVVALTLDRNRYTIAYAKTRPEVMKAVTESPPDIILVSDQVADLNVAAFPKEVETWCGRDRRPPPLVLITSQDIKDMRHYHAVLRKPFSPQSLQTVVQQLTAQVPEPEVGMGTSPGLELGDNTDEHRLQKMFNETFSDEQRLMRETLSQEVDQEERTLLTIPAPKAPAKPPMPLKPQQAESVAELWGRMPTPAASEPPELPERQSSPDLLGSTDSMAYKASLQNQVDGYLRSQDLEKLVHSALEKILPPIVERITQERLDQLLKDQQEFIELKP